MSEEPILYAVENGVAKITLNRPDKLNALTMHMLRDVFHRLGDAAADDAVRVIVLTGAGRAFCAGLDLTVIGTGVGVQGSAAHEAGAPPQWGDDIGPGLERFYSFGWQEFITARKPTIAAINGPVFGWGFVLSLHCDIRFAARSAIFNATFARLGIPAEKNAGWLLTRLIGPARAADLLYTARRFDGVEAERLGVVNAAIEDGQLAAHVDEYAKGIATYSAPRSLAAMKAQIWTALDDPYDTAFRSTEHEQDVASKTDDFREGFKSYTERRIPDFKGR
ncbi:MAG: enoyl-CoA hydratase/isomerase family protein [Alphaproteobacteria bacterium]|nr:enoyl-CoA hydratase/isomerase family protein [Alphaproteobacteria bacterium]